MPEQGPRGWPAAPALPRTPGDHRTSLPKAINSKSWLCNTNEVRKETSGVKRMQPPSPEGGEGRGQCLGLAGHLHLVSAHLEDGGKTT